MPVDFAKALTEPATTSPVTWNQRDLLLYAVSIGAKTNELEYAYELNKSWSPFPTYPLVLPFKGDESSVVNFAELQSKGGVNQFMPAINPNNFVHASQSIEILSPLPATTSGNEGWTISKQLTGLKDVKKGLIITAQSTLFNPAGHATVKMTSSSYAFGSYAPNAAAPLFNQSTVAAPKIEGLNKPLERTPDVVFKETTSKEQALVYRLNGDYNPLHIDPKIGEKNFGGVILHGLCSYGFAARALVSTLGSTQSLSYMSAKFTSPVRPSDTLVTKMWISARNAQGETKVDFIQEVEGGKICLGGGVAIFKSVGSKL